MKSFVRFCPKCDKKKLLIRHGDHFLCWECSPQDEIAKLETGFIDFGDNLEITIKRIKTENHELLAYCPKFFKLLCNILIDKKADWHSQMLVNCALAYFVLPEDLVPEDKEGAEGYLDDLFLCSYVLIKIKEIDKELLIRNWGFEEEILEVIERVYNKTKEILRDKSEEILNLTGLKQYEALPRIVLLTYQLPDTIINIASGGEFDTFDLNVFFSAKGEGKDAKFVYEDDVQKWLDLIRGNYLASNLDNLKLGARKPPLPYSDARLLNILSHTFWFLPNVASCHAMKNLLMQKQNKYYHDYNIVVAAGASAGVGLNALPPVLNAMEEPLKSKSITLSCMKLTTGVTVKPWTGIFMLRNLTSPETYFQAAFRVQSPWTVKNPDGKSPNAEDIIKRECYIFDFAPNRALKQIADYSCNLNPEEIDSEKKIKEFIDFLPVLAYDGSTMTQVDASKLIEMAMSGTTASLLARRWESAQLVNVDNHTLSKILNNPKALEALMSIEGFRSLNRSDIELIINKSESVKKAKQKLANEEDISPKDKKKLSDEEKEYMSKRKEIQKKLIKFATRIPIFMYLTDFRERTLKDVITKLEPGLFKKVTGLNVEDFELLVSLGVFNSNLMNDAVFKFKRYEEASLFYTGIRKHKVEHVGGYDVIITSEEFEKS